MHCPAQTLFPALRARLARAGGVAAAVAIVAGALALAPTSAAQAADIYRYKDPFGVWRAMKVPTGHAKYYKRAQARAAWRSGGVKVCMACDPKSGDGARLAWASLGSGPVLVKAANWLSHLEYDLESPIWRHWYRFFGQHYRLLRHDERGCGMTGGDARGLTLDHWLGDLEAVIDAADLREPFALMGVSQGAAACIA